MLLKVRLLNCRQHEATTLDFVPGINTIVGDNNSGKSTIPEMIEFALYGAKALRDDAKSFIRDGESGGSAVVMLKSDNDVYTVGRNAKDAEVRKNGELDAKYKNNVTAYINRLTGVNHTGFRLGHYVRQKELAAFSMLRPGKRHEMVEKMLKVNAVDKAIAAIKGEVDAKQLAFDVMVRTYQDVDAIDNELLDVNILLTGLKENNRTVLSDLKQLTDVLRVLREDKSKYDLDLQLKTSLETQILQLYTEYTTAELAGHELREVNLKMVAATQVNDEAYKELKAKVEALRTLERQSAAMLSIKTELAEPEPVVPVVVTDPKAVSTEAFTTANIALLNAKNLRESILKLTAGVQCPTCKQDIGAAHVERVLVCAQEMVTTAEATWAVEAESVRLARIDYDAAKKLYGQYVILKAGYDAACLRRQKLLSDYVETAFDAEEQKKVEAELEKSHGAREAWIVLEGEKKRLEPIAAKAADLESRHVELSLKANDIQLVPVDVAYITELEATEKELNDKSRQLASQVAHAEGRMLELQRIVTQMITLKAAIEHSSLELATLKSQIDLFTLFKRHLTSKIRPLLQEVAESLFHRTTKNRYASYQLGLDYEITLTTHRGYIRKLSTISGSENDLACLCLRLAIATLRSTKLAGSLGFVILDEISGSFDDERTRQTLEGLLELREVIPQIINITHKPVEMKFADKIFTVKETNGIAKVS